MRRYYFDLLEQGGLFVDDEGLECPDLQAVRAEAARALAEMARDAARAGADTIHPMSIEVRDESGPVLRVRLILEVTKVE